MPRQFACPTCGESVTTYMRLGESTTCRGCGNEVVVPVSASGTQEKPDLRDLRGRGSPGKPEETGDRFFDRRFWTGAAIGCLLPTLAIVGCVAAVVYLGASMSERLAGMLQSPRIPKAVSASYDWELRSMDDTPLKVSDLRGKVLFINVWATWCPPCVAELPSIADLQTRVSAHATDVVFLCISGETLETLQKFTRKEPPPRVPIYRTTAGIPGEFRTAAIPATFIIDKRGRIVFQHVGAANWNTSECARFLQELAETDD